MQRNAADGLFRKPSIFIIRFPRWFVNALAISSPNFVLLRIDDLVKSQNSLLFVIPAKAGIQ